MKRTVELENKKVDYTLKVSRRARYMRLAVRGGGNIVVTVPYGVAFATIEQFLIKKTTWIVRAIERMLHVVPLQKKISPKEYFEYRERARIFVHTRVEYFNQLYGHKIGGISIRNQKTRWGSCSRKGNLSFNYRIALLPPRLADYIIVHELCHLTEFNHSSKFWALVAKTFPEHKAQRKELRGYRLS